MYIAGLFVVFFALGCVVVVVVVIDVIIVFYHITCFKLHKFSSTFSFVYHECCFFLSINLFLIHFYPSLSIHTINQTHIKVINFIPQLLHS